MKGFLSNLLLAFGSLVVVAVVCGGAVLINLAADSLGASEGVALAATLAYVVVMMAVFITALENS